MSKRSILKKAALATAMILPGLVLGQTINVVVNGQQVIFPGARPIQANGRVLVPLRGVMEQMGAYVDWQAATRTVTATKSGADVVLRLGDRQATVNGRTVYLDVPAQEYRGSTMVPLRFVGEALGADVRWNSATYTVDITTSASGGADQQVDPNQYTPPRNVPPVPPVSTGAIAITSFDIDHTGNVRSGEELRLTLVGTPGGQATFSIPGVIQDVQMTETQRGVYVGNFRVPANAPINISRATAIARLRANGQERLIQSGTTLGFDTQPPVITAITPDENSRVNRVRPNISATFDDGSGTGVDPASIQVLLDRRDVTRDAQVTPTFVSYRPDQALAGGTHEVEISGRDRAGNPVTRTWQFQVRDNQDVIRSLTYDAGGQPLAPGTEVAFTLTGDPGSKVTFSVGDRILDRPMAEASPGKYVGYYTIRRNDSLDNALVTAKLVTQAGETYTFESPTRFNTTATTLEAPRITDPAADSKVGRQLVLRGTAAPGSRIHVKIDYVTSALGVLRMTGTVGEFEVVADDRGNWHTDPIDMDTGLGGGPTNFNIAATTVGANGKTSSVTKLSLRK